MSTLFDDMSAGKQRVQWEDFKLYCSRSRPAGSTSCTGSRAPPTAKRSQIRLMILEPGFGRHNNPRQGASLVGAGYQVHNVMDLPEYPDSSRVASFQAIAPHLVSIRDEIDRFRPHVIACASQGGAYMVGLWQVGYWRGPSVMINAHPSLPMGLPAGAKIVIAHGSNDESYRWHREDLQNLILTAAPNKCMLYYTANSGQMASGSLTRLGDGHVMQSLLTHDTLPRLVDAALSSVGPEMHFIRSWRQQLGDVRLEAQHFLGYSPERLRHLWTSPRRLGRDESKLFQVSPSSEEFRSVATVFKACPPQPPAYMLSSQASWENTPIYRIDRVENGSQLEGSLPYRQALRRSLEEQGLEFDAATHCSWAFHGASEQAVHSIVSDPIAGFQPLCTGGNKAAVWGSGTYFARDAKYVADGQFCPRKADGSRCMLLCLVTLGMPCLGDPSHKGVLPFRQSPHRYNCTVDSLASPEIYVIQHSGAAYPAYLITFG